MNEKTIITIGKTLFWLSFGLGNICLFGYIFTKSNSYIKGGILLLGWGFYINLIAVLVLIVYGIFDKSKLNVCLKSAGIMLLNIPFAMIYTVIGMSVVTI